MFIYTASHPNNIRVQESYYSFMYCTTFFSAEHYTCMKYINYIGDELWEENPVALRNCTETSVFRGLHEITIAICVDTPL